MSTSEAFWDQREDWKKTLISFREAMAGMVKEEGMEPTISMNVFSEEEKIYLRQAIDWLQYLEKRHPVNDEKFLKKFPKEAA